MESALCGAGAVASAAAAQGATAAGGRAAVLLAPAGTGTAAVDIRGNGGWVAHRQRRADVGATGAFAFELLAGDAQQAVDHCLIAHRLVNGLQRPGLCNVDPDVATDLSLVCLPTNAEDLLRVDSTRDPAGRAPTNDTILAAAREAFAAVGKWTGRPCAPVVRRGPENAKYAIVTAGSASAKARAAAQILAADGISCAVIELILLSPTPVEELQCAIGDAIVVAVLDPYGASPGQIDLTTIERAALWDRAQRPVHGLVHLPRAAHDLAQGLRQSFGLEGTLSPPVPGVSPPALAIGAVPSGAWAESLLLEAAARQADRLREPGLARLDLAGVSAVAVADAERAGIAQQLDLLVVAHHSLLDARCIGHLHRGSTVLLLSDALADGAPPALAAATRATLQQAGVRILWLPASAAAPVAQRVRLAYQVGALLACCADSAGSTDEGITLAALQRDGIAEPIAAAYIAGAGGVAELPVSARVPPTTSLPRMAAEGAADPAPIWIDALRRFHVSGSGAVSPAEPVAGLPLRPWSVAPLLAAVPKAEHYPVVVEGDGLVSFAEVARAGLEGAAGSLVAQHLMRLAGTVDAHAGAGTPRSLMDVFTEARSDFVAGLDLSPAASAAMAAELDGLGQRLSPQAAVLGLGPGILVELLARAAAQARRARLEAFHEDVRRLVQRLEERLRVDAGHDETKRDPEELAAAFGGGMQFDIPGLAQRLTVRRGSQRLGEERRQRIEATLAQLRQFIRIDAQVLPDVVLLHPQQIDVGRLPDGVTAVTHDVGMEAAAGYFEAAARQLVELFRAVRVARLDAEDRYRAEYDVVLQRMDWQGLDRAELAMVPPVFVLETAQRVLSNAMSALSTLLRSGRPLHLIILDPSAAMGFAADAAGLAATHPDLGYLAVAHRDALVLQTSLALPGHLYEGLGAVAASLRPSVAVVAVPQWTDAVDPWVQLTAAHYGRVTPGFLYDPDGGATWARRFELEPNPQSDEPWPRLLVQAHDDKGALIEDTETFTFAHAAALSPRCRHAFRVIPTDAWGAEQMPLDEYLLLVPSARARRIPFIWIVNNEGALLRAVMTREMAHACADRLQQWRILQELGGRRNEYVQLAEARARDLAHVEAQREREELQQAHIAELEGLRLQVAGEAFERLAQALLAVDDEGWPAVLAGGDVAGAGSAGESVGHGKVARAPVAEVMPEVAPATVVEPAAEEFVEEGYIDSPMCRSCHDCINMNPRMFQYDGNKQAKLAEPTAGSYAQLVKAAEACPARCIHPGLPREGDATATPELIERARRFG
ncbi:MAG: ferredoxin [bacterium]|nr:ferredoxin [bacterium]